MLRRDRAAPAHDEIQVGAAGIDVGEVGGGWEPAVERHGDGQPRLNGAARTQSMTEVSLQGMERDPIAEDGRGGVRIRNITDIGRRAVTADEVDGIRGSGSPDRAPPRITTAWVSG